MKRKKRGVEYPRYAFGKFKLVKKKTRLKGIRQCHDRNDSKSEHTNALNIVFKVQPTSFIASTHSLSSVSYPECVIIMRNFENLTQTRALFNPFYITDLLFIRLLLWYPATNLNISIAADK